MNPLNMYHSLSRKQTLDLLLEFFFQESDCLKLDVEGLWLKCEKLFFFEVQAGALLPKGQARRLKNQQKQLQRECTSLMKQVTKMPNRGVREN